ncbi:MAG: exo-alpha-sialidase [Actinobacteria bacterium]|nr:exo-alpha-sialidase [Actinomycetota bacterium]
MKRWCILAAMLVLAGCGGAEEPAFEGIAVEDPGPVHVHGLGIDPADGALFIATHTGLFRVGAGENRAGRVGESRQDTMGFSVAGPNRFVGSGHPDLRTDLPPLLGLIESTDAGRTWTPISLLGKADFHVLRSAGSLVYGFDSGNERLLVSGDRGRTWAERDAPEPFLDLAPRPGHPTAAIASGSVLYRTTDGGKRWSALGGEAGYLAWSRPDRLFQVTGTGHVQLSRDGGETWRPLGSIGGEPAAFLAVSATELYAALHDGTIKVSRDAGRNWSIRSRP